jgi:hypothetical protein
MLVGGILVLVTMVLGWMTVTLTWQGQIVAEGTVSGPHGALICGCLLIVAGFVVASTKAGRRTGFRVAGVVASALVLILVVVSFVQSYGAESLVLANSQGGDEVRIQEWIAHGASLSATRSIGLFLALGGGLLGLGGGFLALRKPRSSNESLLLPPPPLPSSI